MQYGDDDKFLQLISCCKHYVAYDLENLANGTIRLDYNAIVTPRDFWETYMPVFHACVVEAQAGSVMCSYNALNGVPTCGNSYILDDILRKQWNWDGFVVSDYDAVKGINEWHHYTNTMLEAVVLAMNSGCDQEGGGDAYSMLDTAVQQGLVNAERIDEATRRLFRARMRLGLFDPPTHVVYNNLSNDTSVVESLAHRNLARAAARQAICLYKNHNNTLPLQLSQIKRVALIGPAADDACILLGMLPNNNKPQ